MKSKDCSIELEKPIEGIIHGSPNACAFLLYIQNGYPANQHITTLNKVFHLLESKKFDETVF